MISVNPTPTKISATNSVAQGPGLSTTAKSSNSEIESARKKAEKLLQNPNLSSDINPEVGSKPVSKPVFVNIMDFSKKITARAMWGMGLGTAGLGVLSYFLIGSKILSLIFAVPTLMAFFIGHSLGKTVIKGQNTLFKNPLEQIEAYISEPQRLDTENVQALQTIDELKDLAKSKSEKREEVAEQLKRFRDIIQVKFNQVQYAKQGEELRIRQDTERLLNALNTIDADFVEEVSDSSDAKEE